MYLKRHVQGILLSICAGSAVYFIVSVIMTTAFEVAEKIQSGDVPLDATAITDLVSQQMGGVEQPTNVAVIVFVIMWFIGVIDSYRLGRADEKVEEEVGK